jgi:nucleoside-triphosphatase THEP1
MKIGGERVKHLFVQGPIRSGKSELIRELLLPKIAKVGGFFVQRIFVGDTCQAFSVNPIHSSEDYLLNRKVRQIEEAKRIFLYRGHDDKWHFQSEVFETDGVLCLKKSVEQGKQLILLDEIGGLELQCTSFMQTLFSILDGEIPCLGVLKSEANSRKLDAYLANDTTDTETRRPHWNMVGSHPKVTVLDLSPEYYHQVKNIISDFVEGALSRP